MTDRFIISVMMFDLAILGLLEDHDLHGYELRKRLGDMLGRRLAVSFGSLYPALGRLERTGYVKAVSSRPASIARAPMTGSLVGELAAFRSQRRQAGAVRGARGKKVYGITDTGRARLHELLVEPDVSDDRDFAVRVAFCDTLAPAERLQLFERRRRELTHRRDARRTPTASPGRPNTYLRSLFERDSAALDADLAWLDRLIDTERTAVDRKQTEAGTEIESGGHP